MLCTHHKLSVSSMKRMQGRPEVPISNCKSPAILRTMHMQDARSQKKETQTAGLGTEGTQSTGHNSSSDRSKRVSQQETLTRPQDVVTPSQPYNSWLDLLPFPRKKARYGPASAPIVSDQVTAQQRSNNTTASEKRCSSWLVPAASHISSHDLSIPTI
jgi:hypothetical protein